MLTAGEVIHAADNPKRRLHRPSGVVLCMKRSAEKSHDLIAHKFIQSTIVVEDRVGGQGIEAVETLHDFSWRESLRQGREAAHVYK